MKMFLFCSMFLSSVVFSFQESELTQEQQQVFNRIEEEFNAEAYELFCSIFKAIPLLSSPSFCKEELVPIAVDCVEAFENASRDYALNTLDSREFEKLSKTKFPRDIVEEIANDFFYVLAKTLVSEDPDFVSIRKAISLGAYESSLLEDLEDEFPEALWEDVDDLLDDKNGARYLEVLANNANPIVQRFYNNCISLGDHLEELSEYTENWNVFDEEEFDNSVMDPVINLYADKVNELINQKRQELDASLEEYFINIK